MFRLGDFITEFLHFLLVGDTWTGRGLRAVFLVAGIGSGFGAVKFLQQPVHVLIWASDADTGLVGWPRYATVSIGVSIALALAMFYVVVALGAAWARSGSLKVRARRKCVDCFGDEQRVQLEVWNCGWVKPIEDIHVFVDKLKPGEVARRELEWSGEGRVSQRLRARGHAHVRLLYLQNPNSPPDAYSEPPPVEFPDCYLEIAPHQLLTEAKYVVTLTVESSAGCASTKVGVYPRRPQNRIQIGRRTWIA